MITFIVKNRKEIHDGYYPGVPSALITITDPDKEFAARSAEYRATLQLKFSDADGQVSDDIVLMSDDVANLILGFVNGCLINNINTFVVNCEAGMSRSAGVAAALAKIYNGDDRHIIKEKPLYNRHVYNTILRNHFEKN